MNEQEKKEAFSLTGYDYSTTNNMDYSGIKAPQAMTLKEALKNYRLTQKDFRTTMSTLETPEASIGQRALAGVKETFSEASLAPAEVSNIMDRLFAGYEYPNASREQALAAADASANIIANIRRLRTQEQLRQGIEPDDVVKNIASGVTQIGTYALLSYFTGGAGLALTGLQEAGSASQEWYEEWMKENKGADFYDRTQDSLAAIGHGVVSGLIERGIGVERLFAPLVAKGVFSKGGKAIRAGIIGGVGEAAEEASQDYSKYFFGHLTGADKRSKDELLQEMATDAIYAGILGGAFGGAAYKINRSRMINQLSEMGMSQTEATEATDQILDDGIHYIMDDFVVRQQLKNAYGDDYNGLVDKIKGALSSAEVGEQKFESDEQLDRYSKLTAINLVTPAINIANAQHVAVRDILDVADIVQRGNTLYLETVDMNDPKKINEAIKSKNEELKYLNSLIGVDNSGRKETLRKQVKLLKNRLETLSGNEEIENARNTEKKAQRDQQKIAETKPEIIADLSNIRASNENEDFVYVGNKKVPVIYEVRSMNEVQPSHIKGEVNPNYTLKELQNRTRGTMTDEAILQERAARLKPEELAISPNLQYGSPLINNNGEVISGNGRFETLRKAYDLGNTSYVEMLNKMGYNTEGIERPVLVRRTADNLTPEQQVAIAEASNVSGTSAFDHARQSLNDAKKLSKDVHDKVTFGDNLPVTERQAYIKEDGDYDLLALQRRFDDAVMAYIIGDTKTFEALVLSGKVSQKIMNGISQQGAKIVEFDKAYPEIGLKEDLRRALVKSAAMKTNAEYMMSITQRDVEDGDTFSSDALLYMMTFSKNSSELSGNIADYIRRHSQYLDNEKDNMFADDPNMIRFDKNDITYQTIVNSTTASGKFDSDGKTTDANLKALFANKIPADATGYGSVEQSVGSFDRDNENTYYQEDLDDRNLVAVHSLDASNLSKAIDFGGFPVPSIAVIKKDQPFTFSEDGITLVGNKDLIDPANPRNEVYNRDIWSVTFPSKTYKSPTYANITKFKEKVVKYYNESMSKNELDSFAYTADRGNTLSAMNEFVNSTGAKLMYLEENTDEKIEFPKKDRALDALNEGNIDAEFAEAASKLDSNADNFKEAMTDLYKQMVERKDYSKYGRHSERMKQADMEYAEDGLPIYLADRMKKASDNYIRNKGVETYDYYEIKDYINEKIKKYDGYDSWATNYAEKELFGEPKVQVGKSLEPFTLDNVVDAMVEQATVASQDSLLFGSGKIIASGAKQLESIKEIKEEGKKLVTKEQSEENMKELQDQIDAFTSSFMTENDVFNNMERKEDSGKAIAKVAKNKKPTKESLQKALNKEFGDRKVYSDEVLSAGMTLIDNIKKLSRYYFEAKPQRAVGLTEFSAAIIPTDSKFDEIAKKVQDNGLDVIRSDDQQNALQQIDTQKGIFFQGRKANGFFDAELKAIVIGSNFNYGTLPHEMAHFWLDKMFNIYKSGEATEDFKNMFQGLVDVLGIKEDQTQLTRDQHEQYATMTEGYLFNRAAFPDGQKPAMQLFFDWCPQQYKSMLDIGFRNEAGDVVNPIFSQEALAWFDDFYSLMSGLNTSNMSLIFDNPDNYKGEVKESTVEAQEIRDKLIESDKQDPEDPMKDQSQAVKQAYIDNQSKADPLVEESYNEAINREEAREKTPVEKFKQYVRIGRGTNTREEMDLAAQEFIKSNPDRAKEIAFGSPIAGGIEGFEQYETGNPYVENNSGIDRGVLIMNVMQGYSENSPEYAALYHNLALTRSYAGKTGGLTNDISQQFYLKGYADINRNLSNKIALKKYGKRKDAINLWNRDVDNFIRNNMDSILSTAADSAERDRAINKFFDDAKQVLAMDNPTQLFQESLTRIRKLTKKDKQQFIEFARKQIKKMAGAEMSSEDVSKLMNLSIAAQKASKDIDSSNMNEAVAASIAIRQWQDFVNKKGVSKGFLDKLVGEWMPRAMLSGISTHVVNNVSNFVNDTFVKAATIFHYGNNVVSNAAITAEQKRLWAIYNATGQNLAESMRVDQVSKLHNENYQLPKATSALQKLDPFRLLGQEDFYFRSKRYLDTLARIASKDANGDAAEATRLFNEYKQMNSTNPRAIEARMQAITVGNIAVFTNDGQLAKIVSNVRRELDKINLTAFGESGHYGLGTIIAPFAKVPTNIVGMGLEALASPFKTLGYIAGVKKNWTIQDTIAAEGFVGGLATVLCYIAAACDYNPPYEYPEPYDPNKPYDAIKIGGAWIGIDTFGALSTPLRFALTMVNAHKSGMTAEKTISKGLKTIFEQVPFADTNTDYMMSHPVKWLEGESYNQINKVVPALIKPLIKMTNRELGVGNEWWPDDFLPKWKQKFSRHYGIDRQQTSINDYIHLLYGKAWVDSKQ